MTSRKDYQTQKCTVNVLMWSKESLLEDTAVFDLPADVWADYLLSGSLYGLRVYDFANIVCGSFPETPPPVFWYVYSDGITQYSLRRYHPGHGRMEVLSDISLIRSLAPLVSDRLLALAGVDVTYYTHYQIDIYAGSREQALELTLAPE